MRNGRAGAAPDCGRKQKQHWPLFFLLFAVLGMLLFLQTAAAGEDRMPETWEITEELRWKPLSVIFPDVGQGLCVIVCSAGHVMVYDSGSLETAETVISALRDLGTKTIDVCIASHYDIDHIGGFGRIFEQFPCERVLAPDYAADTAPWRIFLEIAQEYGLSIEHPFIGGSFPLGDALVAINGPLRYDAEQENDRSLAATVEYKNDRILLTGDMGREEELDLLANGMLRPAAVLSAGHHGSSGSTTSELLEAIHPEYVVISCGKDNDYGHPSDLMLARAAAAGCSIFRTDLQGCIAGFSSGDGFTFSCKPLSFDELGNNEAGEYVCNLRTMRFHVPGCSYAASIGLSNRREFAGSRWELILEGFLPCGVCRP